MTIYGSYLDQTDALAHLGTKLMIVTDDHLENRFAEPLAEALNALIFSIPPGEAAKTRATKERIEDAMLGAGFSRDCAVIALGGGMVSDLAGFVAATFCRGVPLAIIPTSLLSMVDAAVGGKRGVNTPHGKNLIGAFHPAALTIYDTAFLKTLPHKEKLSGMVEVIKYGIISDKALFATIETEKTDWENHIEKYIAPSVACKEKVVKADPYEKGLRRILNFGHTFGHAIEHVTAYGRSHGEAVATGMWAEARLSHALGALDEISVNRIEAVLDGFGYAKTVSVSPETLLQAMSVDKKGEKGVPRFSLVEEIGQMKSSDGAYCETVPEEVLQTITAEVAVG